MLEWAIAYAAVAWAVLGALDLLAGLREWPPWLLGLIVGTLLLGLFGTLSYAWTRRRPAEDGPDQATSPRPSAGARDAGGEGAAAPSAAGSAPADSGRHRALGSIGAVAAMVTIGVGGVAGLGTWLMLDADKTAVDERKLVGFPLVDRRPQQDEGGGVALLLGSALEHADPVKWIDGWHWLEERQRRDIVALTAAEATRITLERGARHYIVGNVLDRGDSVAVVLQLHDAVGDSVVRQSTGTALRGQQAASFAAARALRALLPAIQDPGRPIDLQYLTDRDPSAIAVWIEGQKAYREMRFSVALERFREALAIDSLLAPAALAGAQAASWEHRPEEARELLHLALRETTTLSPRQRHLARGLDAHQRGDRTTALSELGRATALDPEWAEAWSAIGEVHRHHVPPHGRNDTAAVRAFRRAIELDPEFRSPQIHLTEYALRDRDLRAAARHLDDIRDRYTDSASFSSLEITLDCLRQRMSPSSWRRADLSPAAILVAGARMASAGLAPDCAEDAFRAVLERPDASTNQSWGAMSGLTVLLIARGRGGEAVALLDSAQAAGNSAVPFLHLFAAAAGAPAETQAAAADAMIRKSPEAPYEGVAPLTGWSLGIWHASRRDTTALRLLGQRVSEAAGRLEAVGRTADTDRGRSLAASLNAHLEAIQGRHPQAITALREVLDAPRPPDASGLASPRAFERIRLAQLLLEQGDAAGALEVAAAFDHPDPLAFVAFLPQSLVIRHAAARALGRDSEVGEYRRRIELLGRSDLLQSSTESTRMER